MTSIDRFCWYELRTTDPGAARGFYADVIGLRAEPGADVFCLEGRPVAGLSRLPERAAALGAPSHWLGFVEVRDVEGATRRIVEAGGSLLGPVQTSARTLLRDPFGSVVALRAGGAERSSGAVVWHELHTQDPARAWALYGALFGWRATETLDLGPELGAYHVFSWDEPGPSVGGMVGSARMPHIHPHWLFSFRVEDLDAALAKVRSLGGTVVEPRQLPSGERVAACEDPQGAAFALRAPARG